MADEPKTEKTELEKPAAAAPVAPEKPAAASPAAAAAASIEKPAAAAATHEGESDEDEEGNPTPDDKGFVRMPFTKFLKRVGRMTAKELRKHFGTTDLSAIVEERKELQVLRAEKEERERAAMTERERLQADTKAAHDRADAAERRAEAAEESRMVERTEAVLQASASKLFAEAYQEVALDALAKYMRRHPNDFKKPTHAEAWLKEYAEKHPAMRIAAAAPDAKKEEKDVKDAKSKVPADDKIRKDRPAAKGSGESEQKTARPGQPNSLSKFELRKQGYNW